ncbi:MAG: DUF3810 domain-containing protein [Turicibacter sp.]|nr:DUF3810 domain-containing protein [Turicibacter sp.]
MKQYKRSFIIILTAFITYLLRHLFSYFPQFIETYYSKRINKWFIQILSQLTGLFPFSIFEILIYLIVIGLLGLILYYLIRIYHEKQKWGSLMFQFLLNLFTSICLGYTLFVWFWGINYHRPSLEVNFGLQQGYYHETDLVNLYTHLIKQSNKARLFVQENEQGVFIANGDYHDIFSRASVGYDVASKTYPILAGDYGEPKPILASSLMNYTNITGIYSPFTAEANVNIAVPDSTLLFTTMHEMAHQRGYASENEANFIAFITCIHHTDTDFIYSGYLSALRYTNIALSKVNHQALMTLNEQLNEGVKRDLRYLNEFWAQYDGKVEKTFNTMNQTYLTLNGVIDGVQSYGRVVDLLLTYYDDQNKLVN